MTKSRAMLSQRGSFSLRSDIHRLFVNWYQLMFEDECPDHSSLYIHTNLKLIVPNKHTEREQNNIYEEEKV